MNIEQYVNNHLNKHQVLKKCVKRIYQLSMYAISRKVRCEGNVVRVSPNDGAEYFFGYYDKSPWSGSGRYMLCLKALNTWSDAVPAEPAEILLIDLQEGSVRKLAQTHSWNVQQGCMVQWLGPDFNNEIIYNDFRYGRYCAIILNIWNGQERLLDMPVYSVAQSGITALTLDFSRLHRLRNGYGYSNLEDTTKTEKIPDRFCIWRIDIQNSEIKPILKYTDFFRFEQRLDMVGAEHKLNHIMLSPDSTRFMVLHRWFKDNQKHTRLVTCNIDGSDMYNLSDDDMVSHCCWKNNEEILAYENKRSEGLGYYLMKDRTREYLKMWPELTSDGHPSFSPNGQLVVTDTYPDRARVASIKVMEGQSVKTIARIFIPFKYDNDTRSDLHPRWSRTGEEICFDGSFTGNRGVYTIRVPYEAFIGCLDENVFK